MNEHRLARRIVAALAALGCVLGGLTPTPAAADGPDSLIINELYARGGSANQPYADKFVELYNPAAEAVDLSGTTLQYRAATRTGLASGVVQLSGSIAPQGYFLIKLGSNGGTGAALPTPDQDASALNPSGTNGTIFLAATTVAVSPDDAAVLDKLGYGTSNSPEGTAAAYTGGNSTPGSLTRTNFVDTNDNAADFTFTATPSPQNGSPVTEPQVPHTPIAELQGTGRATPLEGQTVTTQGVVTAAYPTGGFGGFYLQTPGTGGTPKAAGEASDGIFVASATAAAAVALGDCVDVTGTVGESYGLTQLAGTVTVVPAADCAPVTPTELAALPDTDAAREAYEGMLVLPTSGYTVTNNYALNQYGQLGLAAGDAPLRQATDAAAPGAEAVAYEAANLARLITLDDGSSWNYLTNNAAKATALPYLSAETPLRTGTPVQFTSPVILDFRYQWNFQPLGQVIGHDSPLVPIASGNTREASAPEVGGDLTLGAFNVLNYFTDLGQDESGCRSYDDRLGNPVTTSGCQVRGAYTPEALRDQQAKLVAAINGLDASVVGLMEVENSAGVTYANHERDRALAALVGALNAAAGRDKWAFVPSPTVTPPNEDIIRTAFIYQPAVVTPVGASEIGLDDAFANARYPLAQRFKAVAGTLEFVAIVNHFKSKGSGEDDGTGQGLSNPSREAQARALAAWAGQLYADDAVFLLGDFNAYTRETPLQLLQEAGYTNVVKTFEPNSASYQFQGRLGSLDHVFANAKAMAAVTGAGIWDINGDESVAFQYSRRNYNVVDFHADNVFASSDHDPLLVGLNATLPAPSPEPEPSPEPTPTPTTTPSPQQSATAEPKGPAGTASAASAPGKPGRPGLPNTGSA